MSSLSNIEAMPDSSVTLGMGSQGEIPADSVGPPGSEYISTQCCGTVTIFYGSGSGSDFWKVMVPVPVPTFEKLWFRFRFRLLKSYGSGSGSYFRKVPVPVPATYLAHKKQIFQKKIWNFFCLFTY